MSNVGEVRKTFDGTYGIDKSAFDQMTDFTKEFRKAAADAMAADTTAAQKIWTNPFDFNVRIVRALASGDAGLTAHDTNYAQIILSTDDAANGAPVTAAMWQTTLTTIGGVVGTGTWTTDVAEAAELSGTGITVAAQTIVPGANLFLSIAKQGAGVVVPISSYTIQLRRV
jgi:hypothetical protein